MSKKTKKTQKSDDEIIRLAHQMLPDCTDDSELRDLLDRDILSGDEMLMIIMARTLMRGEPFGLTKPKSIKRARPIAQKMGALERTEDTETVFWPAVPRSEHTICDDEIMKLAFLKKCSIDKGDDEGVKLFSDEIAKLSNIDGLMVLFAMKLMQGQSFSVTTDNPQTIARARSLAKYLKASEEIIENVIVPLGQRVEYQSIFRLAQ